MKRLLLSKSVCRACAISLALAIVAIGLAHFRASAARRSQGRGLSEISARAQNPDSPWIKLQNSRSVSATYRDATARTKDGGGQIEPATRSLNRARPLSLASNDFNADGFPDRVCGYATANGGLVSIQRGNPAAYAPEDPEVLRGIGQKEFPDPFLPDAGYVELPQRPDFIGTVDFNRDVQMDIVAATRGSDGMYLLAGDGHGGFAAPPRL